MTILTIDQFEATCKLLNLLENLGVQKAELVHANLIEQEGDDWAVCDNCMELVSECGRQCYNPKDGKRHAWCGPSNRSYIASKN